MRSAGFRAALIAIIAVATASVASVARAAEATLAVATTIIAINAARNPAERIFFFL